jgi:16S rRNA (guanine527-N7)-methyltransferase
MTYLSLKSLCGRAGLEISDNSIGVLEKFVDIFTEKNKVINLTKINSREEFLIKHILDSLLVNRFLRVKSGMKIADLGAGGGLPGIPLAILNREVNFTLIDSVQKKINCVKEFSAHLYLNNVIGLSERLEVIGKDKKYREQFDVVVARALAPLPVLLELALPLVKISGIFAAMKGPGVYEEINAAANAMKQMDIGLPEIEKYDLPDDMGERSLLIFKKIKPTPNIYPRRVGVPSKSPL